MLEHHGLIIHINNNLRFGTHFGPSSGICHSLKYYIFTGNPIQFQPL